MYEEEMCGGKSGAEMVFNSQTANRKFWLKEKREVDKVEGGEETWDLKNRGWIDG